MRTRGVMECFYGPPWTFDQRLEAVRLVAEHGGNRLVHGPAADAHTGAEWRASYTDAERAQFATIAAEARNRGIDYVWRVSPSAPLHRAAAMRLAEPDERATLATRCLEMGELGVTEILLAFDDLARGDDGNEHAHDDSPLAVAQAEVIAELAGRLAAASLRLSVCPTEYCGTTASAYRRRLGELVDPSIPFYWTGPRVVSARISAADAARAKQQYGGRDLLLWDNYPVNDWNVDMHEAELAAPRRAMLAPLDGRDPGLLDVVDGYFTNGGSNFVISRPAIRTALDWARGPRAYRSGEAFDAALRADGVDPSLMERLRPALGPAAPERPAVHPAVQSALAVLTAPADADVRQAKEQLCQLGADARALAEQTADLAVALRRWSEPLAAEAAAADVALAVIVARATCDEAGFHHAAERLALLPADHCGPVLASGLLSAVVTFARGLCGPSTPDRW